MGLCPGGSAAGTTTDPVPQNYNPESYRMNEKGDPLHLFVPPVATSPACLVRNLKLSVGWLLYIPLVSSSAVTGRSLISSSFPLK